MLTKRNENQFEDFHKARAFQSSVFDAISSYNSLKGFSYKIL